METARFAVDVVAGLLPGTPDPELTRRWGVTSKEWQQAVDDGKQSALLAETAGRAAGYATLLQLQPDRVNWVKTEWVWF